MLAAVVVALLCLAPSALADPVDIHSGSSQGLSDIWIGNDLSCQVVHAGVGRGDFYGGDTTGPEDCGTVLSLTGDATGTGSYGIFGGAGDFTSVTAPTLTGSGTQADPYVVTTAVSAGSTGVNVTETDTYVTGDDFYRTAITVTNNADNAWTGAVYHAGDCYLNGSDAGSGFVDSANHGIACTQNSNSLTGAYMEFADVTGGSNYFEGGYGTAEDDADAQTEYPNTCDCTNFEDNGMGIDWDFNLPAGRSTTFTVESTFTAEVAATGGQSFSGNAPLALNNATVANFTDANTDTSASDYTATIDWGDSSSSAGTITGSNGSFSVTGSHTYSSPGSYTITVTITPNNGNSAVTTDSATVSGITASGGQSFSGNAPLALNNATVANFTDAANTDTSASDYTATIDWGDSSSSAGTITGSNGSFSVTGSHTYSSPGSYTITVTITPTNGSGANATDSAVVTAPPPPSSKPTPVNTGAPSVTSSSGAVLTGTATPNGLQTTGHWIYGLVQADRGPGFSGSIYDQSTPSVQVGSDYSSHTISFPVSGLMPGSTYSVEFVASNSGGTTVGPAETFTTPAASVPVVPPAGKENFIPHGTLFVLVNGKFVKLTSAITLPSGTIVDAQHGSLTLVSSSFGNSPATDAKAKQGKKPTKSKTYTGTFTGGVFKVAQTTGGANKGLTTLSLVENIPGAPSTASCKANGAGDEAHAALSSRVLQTLRSRASGRYSTRGRYAAGTVRGTAWTTSDRCDGTLIAVQLHSVLVTNLITHARVLVTAGHHYLAKAPTGKHG